MLHTLELPVNLEFKWTKMNGFEDTLAPFVFGGPVFTFNIAHSKCKTMQFPFGSVGLRAGIGAEILRRWQVTGAYTWGMTYTIKARQLQDYSARNRFWSVGVLSLIHIFRPTDGSTHRVRAGAMHRGAALHAQR